jgi:hypothetical protein
MKLIMYLVYPPTYPRRLADKSLNGSNKMVLMDNTYKIDAKLDLSFKKSSTNPKY